MSPRLITINTGMLAGLDCEKVGALVMERTALAEKMIRLRVVRIAPWPDMGDAVAMDVDMRVSWRRVAEIGHIVRERTGLGHLGSHSMDVVGAKEVVA